MEILEWLNSYVGSLLGWLPELYSKCDVNEFNNIVEVCVNKFQVR